MAKGLGNQQRRISISKKSAFVKRPNVQFSLQNFNIFFGNSDIFQTLRGFESNMLMYIVHVCTVFPQRKGDKSNTAFGGAYPMAQGGHLSFQRNSQTAPFSPLFKCLWR